MLNSIYSSLKLRLGLKPKTAMRLCFIN